jgi:hypothetical protein
MSSELLYSEIFEKFEKETTREGRIGVLRKHGDQRFIDFLFMAFHPDILFDVEPPNYRPAVEPAGLNWAYLDSEINKLYRFIKNHPQKPEGLKEEKQKQLLLVILESLHKDEAALLIKMFKKDLQIKYLTPKIINEAFPQMNIPAEQ